MWTSPVLIHNYLKANRIVVTGPKSRAHCISVTCPAHFPKSRSNFAHSLVERSPYYLRKLSRTHLINSSPSKALALWQPQSILEKLKPQTMMAKLVLQLSAISQNISNSLWLFGGTIVQPQQGLDNPSGISSWTTAVTFSLFSKVTPPPLLPPPLSHP